MVTKLPTRPLGKNGPLIPALGFGTMGLSTFYGVKGSDEERFEVLDRVHELGCTYWDSAQLYGDCEELLGKWFTRTGKRKDVFLATKFGNKVTADGKREINNDSDYIRNAVKESLERLQTDYIDLLYCHRFNGKVPVENIIRTMKEFVDAGVVKHIGLSECGPDTLRRASAIHPIAAYQIEYSPFSMDIEKPDMALLKTCRELGIATVAYSPLGRGMLTGQYKSRADFPEGDFRLLAPRFSDENFPKNLQLVDKLKEIGKRKGCTSGQLTLAWLINQGDDIFAIPGTKKIKYLEENMGALDVVLTEAEDKEIRAAIENAEEAGTRMPEGLMGDMVVETPPAPQLEPWRLIRSEKLL